MRNTSTNTPPLSALLNGSAALLGLGREGDEVNKTGEDDKEEDDDKDNDEEEEEEEEEEETEDKDEDEDDDDDEDDGIG
jgi:hypothetical protein